MYILLHATIRIKTWNECDISSHIVASNVALHVALVCRTLLSNCSLGKFRVSICRDEEMSGEKLS